MRTTLRIDDDVYSVARSLAESEGRSLGEVISELLRKGLAPRPESTSESGFPVFSVSPDAAPLTPEMVRQAAEDS